MRDDQGKRASDARGEGQSAAGEQSSMDKGQLDRLFQLSVDLLCVASADGFFLQLNPAWERTLGYSRQELSACSFMEFVHPDDRAATLDVIAELAHGVPTVQFENRYRCKDGGYKWLAWNTMPEATSGLLYAVARDVTATKQAEQKLREREYQLLEARAAAVEDLGYRKRSDEQNRLLARVTQTISEATDVERALELTLSELCESGGWDYGEFWFPADNGCELTCHGASYARDPKTTELFRKESVRRTCLPDVTLPGRVWKHGLTEWYADLTEADESVFCRSAIARQVGLKTCVGVPLAMDDSVAGVLVLLRHQATPRDEHQLTVLAATATQLGGLLQRKRAEHALRASEERLRFATRASSDVIYDWDLVTNEVWLGEALLRTFGYEATTRDGAWRLAHVHPDDREQLEATRRVAIEGTHTLWSGDYRFLRRDGSYAHVFDRGYILRSADGKALRIIGSMMDVSERVRAAETLREAKEAAEGAARVKSQFLANMSHEIRTPLTAVLGFADLLLDPKLNESDRLNYAMTIRRNGEHLLAILNDILDISKVEAGKLTIEMIECSPTQVLTDVASLMRVRAKEKGLSFEVEYDGPVPRAVRSDPTRLRQIVLNLVSNAIKFTDHGGVRVITRCEGDEHACTLVIRVSDTGIGMDEKQVGRLFQPFAQADASMTRRYGGSGLGLGICAPLAAALGGAIEVDSEPSRGSTFTLRLPVDLAGATMISDPHEALFSSEPASALHQVKLPTLRGHVLLAEDGHDNQVLIGTVLRRQGFEVTVVENGKLAVERALLALEVGQPFDVILMDMQMPELDGYGATSQLRTKGYRGTIVALTAHAMAGERERCLAAGCDDYLTKPIERSRLIAAVSGHVDDAQPTLPPPAAEGGAEVRAESDALGTEAIGERLVSEFADDPDMAEIVASFVNGLPAQLATLLDASKRDERALVSRIAHQLKGAAGGYGFPIITKSAARLEELAKSSVTPITQALEELVALCERTQIATALAEVSGDRPRLPTLLVIDDSPQIQELVEARLRTEQVVVHKAANAAEGLRLARELAPDLVLLDIDLPDADGFEVCRVLKADPRTTSTPVLFLTGTADPAAKAAALDLGAVDYVTKPFDATELRARVRSALRTKRYHDLLATRAQVDGLTGVWNRLHFDSRLTDEVSSAVRHDRALSIVMLDIDHFKNVNDSYGHPFGDRVLQAVAGALLKTVRTSDIVCRYGGEELVVILRETDAKAAMLAGERMRRAVAELAFTVKTRSVAVTASLGVVATEPAGALGRAALQPAAMVAAADVALYRAKRAGRNQVVLGTLG
jgi:diguanylate cyclase (GGDEF)-like protein/PAS domain S-box-containing protein